MQKPTEQNTAREWKIKLSLCFVKHHCINTYGRVGFSSTHSVLCLTRWMVRFALYLLHTRWNRYPPVPAGQECGSQSRSGCGDKERSACFYWESKLGCHLEASNYSYWIIWILIREWDRQNSIIFSLKFWEYFNIKISHLYTLKRFVNLATN
jgi:hypothetical protein